MRAILILLLLSCGAAFGQDTLPGSVIQRMNDNLRQSVGDALKSRIVSRQVAASRLLRMARVLTPAIGACSIPLLNVAPPGTPVPMPNMAIPGIIDNMNIVPPAAACPADFGQVSAPPAKP